MTPRGAERGAALVAVLAMVLLLAGFASVGLARLRAATDRTIDIRAEAQAHLLADAGVRATLPLILLAKVEANRGARLFQRPIRLEMGGGRVIVRLSDGGACFNLNSLSRRPEADAPDANPADFSRLLAAVGVPLLEADRLARATADTLGATGLLWADPSEWLGVPGVTARHWEAVRPFLCTLPVREPSAFNVNTLKEGQAPLLVALGLSPADARRTLATRPTEGWTTANGFWASARPEGSAESSAAAVAGVSSRWVRLDVLAETGQARAARDVLLDTLRSPASIAAVTWTLPPPAADGQGGAAMEGSPA